MSFPLPQRVTAFADASGKCDAVILVSSRTGCGIDPGLDAALSRAAEIDRRVGSAPVMIHAPEIAGSRLIHAPTGSLTTDYADTRAFGDAARAGMALAKAAGAVDPLLILDGVPDEAAYRHAAEVAYLAASQELWEPLEAREAEGGLALEPVRSITLLDPDGRVAIEYLAAVESGRRLARDLCGTEPERMTPDDFAKYCIAAFAGTTVDVTTIEDYDVIRSEYPLMAAVARASMAVARHQPRVIHLSYQGAGPIERTLFLVGKAVTYDTGGADLKTDGRMAGMSRDKGGGAAVAGFMKALAALAPPGIKAVAAIGAVRNSIGADAYVADEIIRSRAGKRVRIGNADAEGRLVMADLLAELREQAEGAVAPELVTIATLTSHAMLALGRYTAVLENGPARKQALGDALSRIGDDWGDGCEVSRLRRDDWTIIKPRSSAYDILSSNSGPSSAIARGHQFPMAFLIEASGLDRNGLHSARPLPYLHLDIAGSALDGSDWKHDKPSGAPVAALAARYLLSPERR